MKKSKLLVLSIIALILIIGFVLATCDNETTTDTLACPGDGNCRPTGGGTYINCPDPVCKSSKLEGSCDCVSRYESYLRGE